MAKKYTKEDFPVTLTVSVEASLHHYFRVAEQALKHFEEYLDRHRTLDFSLMRRFLRTTYKTLHDIDPEYMEQKLQVLYTNLDKMAKIHDDFQKKSKTGLHSYAHIFLAQQTGYTKYESQLMQNSEEIAYLRLQTERFKDAVEKQQKAVENASKLMGEKQEAEEELKRIKRLENSSIVRLGELVDQNSILYEVITDFKKMYESDFLLAFSKYVHAMQPKLLQLLNAMAFEFDIQLWHKSKDSKVIQNYFKNAYAGEVVSSRTYLEYFLRNLDQTKLSNENKALHELLRVLKATTGLKVVMYMANLEDLIIFKSAFESDGAGHEVVSFTEAKPALKAVLTCAVDIVILDLALQQNILESFMRTYRENAVKCKTDVRFIFVSDNVDEESIKRVELLGGHSIIERELEAVEILDTLYAALKEN